MAARISALFASGQHQVHRALDSASRWFERATASRNSRIAASIVVSTLFIVILAGAICYLRYSHLIDARLKDGPFGDSVNIYAAPLVLSVGDALAPADLVAELRTAGYDASPHPNAGSWRLLPDGVEISPAGSPRQPVTVFISHNQIDRMIAGGKEIKDSTFGSPLITTLSSRNKEGSDGEGKNEERLLVTFASIPPVLVNAIVSAEDKRFFQHSGLDLRRIAKAAYVDFKDNRKAQGASTLTMQLVRGLLLEPDKLWMRKIAEAMMTVHLEHQWSKQKIFETYVNQVYLGRQAAYSVHGFGEGSRLYFGKELRDITLPEAALLAGLVQRPSYFNPFRYPERARERRDLVLSMMRDNHYINAAEYRKAVNEPVQVASGSPSEGRASYFLDLVSGELQDRLTDDASVRSVYSTIDLNLQHAADEAIRTGMQEVDKLLAKRPGKPGPGAEVALIALDPHTGEIKALVGGRDYDRSQLNRILAKRPPGSVFKPFVYAAALNTAISGAEDVYTPATTVDDTPTTFWFAGKPYEPGNYGGEVLGTLTLREALARSDNVAAVQVAQGIGYNAVVQMARRAGLNNEIQATPAVALGAYQVTPLEMAGAYTVFANGGKWVKPEAISSFRDVFGVALPSATSGSKPPLKSANQALDPRVNWLMVSMLQEVMRTGTAAGVRSRGFTLPAGGKTGTSHDGWFAGFTSQLLCVVWVGFDDYRELNLEGAKSALPIWTEFMKRASHLSPYKNAREFPMPPGIEQASICLESGKLASPQCPDTRDEYFVRGSEPEKCDRHQYAIAPPLSTSSNPRP